MKATHLSGALLLAAVFALSGCGDQDGDASSEPTSSATDMPTETTPTESPTSPEPTETEPTGPACASVWVAGEVVPADYEGCLDEEKGKWVEVLDFACSSGEHVVTFRRNFYAVDAMPIVETSVPLARDKAFKKIMATCGA